MQNQASLRQKAMSIWVSMETYFLLSFLMHAYRNNDVSEFWKKQNNLNQENVKLYS